MPSTPQATGLDLQAADAYCRALSVGHYENFSVASAFVGGRKRRDLMRIYAFCRTTDDFGDETQSCRPEPFDYAQDKLRPEGAESKREALERLERWRSDLEAMFAGRQPIHPVLVALRETVETYSMPRQPFFDLIQANVRDQSVKTYVDWPQLEAYCMLSAAPVGRMVLRVFAISDPRAEKLSDDVCIGLQLANHAQDVSRDAAIGRTYLLESDLRAGGTAAAVRGLVERARSLLDSGRSLEPMAPGALRVQLALYRLGGLAICDAIERAGFATDRTRPSVSTSMKVGIALRAVASVGA